MVLKIYSLHATADRFLTLSGLCPPFCVHIYQFGVDAAFGDK